MEPGHVEHLSFANLILQSFEIALLIILRVHKKRRIFVGHVNCAYFFPYCFIIVSVLNNSERFKL